MVKMITQSICFFLFFFFFLGQIQLMYPFVSFSLTLHSRKELLYFLFFEGKNIIFLVAIIIAKNILIQA